MAATVTGLYQSLAVARDVARDLVDQGFSRENISLLSVDREARYAPYIGENYPREDYSTEEKSDVGEGAATGAGVGALLGGIGGLLVGLGALAIPAFGPVLVAGPLAATLLGAGAGAAAGGLVGALVDLGIPESQAELYAEGVRRGGTLVAVATDDERTDKAERVMAAYNPIDIETEVERWRAEGWTAYETEAEPYPAFETHTSDWHHHYEETYADTGRPYTDYERAYRYGYALATVPDYVAWDWAKVEPEARRRWEAQHEGQWIDFQEAIHYGWTRGRSATRS